MSNQKIAGLTLATALLVTAAAGAQDRTGDGKKPAAEPPKAEQSVTQHSLSIGGKPISYTATAGTLLVRNDKDEPTASIGYIAYVQRAAGESGDAGRRPITFAYNGGPGSSSVWLHMGALGPRRIVTADAGRHPAAALPAGGQRLQHPRQDRPGDDRSRRHRPQPRGAAEAKDKDFWGVDPDIESVGALHRAVRQRQPPLGLAQVPARRELRHHALGGHRRLPADPGNMAFNGVILVSVALDLEAVFPLPGVDKSYPLFLPTFAATAWYHHTLPQQPAKLEPFLDEVRKFALGEYASALMKGDALSDQEADSVAEKLHQYTGLSTDFVKKAKLRVRESQFTQELMRNSHTTVGRL